MKTRPIRVWALLFVLCACGTPHSVQAAAEKATVRVQITYLTVTGPAQFAPPDFNPHFDDPRQALKAFQYQAQRQHMAFSTMAGPVATSVDGTAGKGVTGTAIGSAIGRTADGKVIDDHIASFQEHHLSVLSHRSADGTVRVEISLTDSAYTADDRTHRHVRDATPRVVQKTLTFHPGDTLLLSAPIPGKAGGDYAFATVTLVPARKG